jgi:[ribosomal protein S5]-alanine N-acetyltransferase
MAMLPVLETPRLRLRLPSLDDVDGIAAYAADPDVSRYVSWPRHRSTADAEAFLRYAVAAVEQQRECNWVIEERSSSRVAGTIGLRMQGHRVELGYALARAHWGRGVATEAGRAVVEWSLGRPEIHRVWAVCDIENVASARVLEKLGMRREGRLAAWAIMPNLSKMPRDCWCYARVK